MDLYALYVISIFVWMSVCGLIGILGSLWVWWVNALVVVPPLIHFTSKSGHEKILVMRLISCRGSIFATDRCMLSHPSTLERTLRLLIEPHKTCYYVPIPARALQHFHQSRPIGIYTLWKFFNGHFYAGYRKLNIDTAVFSERDFRRAKVFTYLADVLVYLTCGALIWVVVSSKLKV